MTHATKLSFPMAVYRCAIAIVLFVLLGLTLAAQTRAEIVVRLKDGRILTLPVTSDEIESLSIDGEQKHIKSLPPASSFKADPFAPDASDAGIQMKDGRRVLSVGADHHFKTPGAAAKAARNGDVIEITAGAYPGNVAVWVQNNLIIRGIGGKAHMNSGGRTAESKAIWVLKGNNTTVENIEFSGAKVGDLNGAGIRLEGTGLKIENCYFHHNQMGLMTGANPGSDVYINNSVFESNSLLGVKTPRIGHNIYIGTIRSFTLTKSHIFNAHTGHNVKSRAALNKIIDNRIEDGPSGNASYLLDLPAGGVAEVKGNYFHQGSQPENSTLISYGAESNRHVANDIIITENEFINDYRIGTFVQNHLDVRAIIRRNSFKGAGQILRGKGTYSDNQVTR